MGSSGSNLTELVKPTCVQWEVPACKETATLTELSLLFYIHHKNKVMLHSFFVHLPTQYSILGVPQ